jgi:Tol biopolymer transport system component
MTVGAAENGYDLFQQALLKERAAANVPEAIQIYERIVKDFSSNRPLVAKTLVNLGSLYEKQQDKQKARAAYERVTRDFTMEADAVTQAHTRLAVLDGSPALEGPTIRVAAKGIDADSNALITPDGRYLVRPDWDTGDLAVRDMVLGGQSTRMYAKAGNDESSSEVESAILSADHQWIVYSWSTSGKRNDQLRIMPNRVGGKSVVLVDDEEYVIFKTAGWSADGKQVLVAAEKQDRTWQLAWVSRDNGKLQSLKSLGWRFLGDRPTVSPDGRYVAYSALAVDPGKPDPSEPALRYPQQTPEPLDQHIYVIPADASGPETELVKGANINEAPVWTPDGTRILFVSNRSAIGFRLFSLGVKDGKAMSSPSLVNTSVSERIVPIGMTDKGSFYYLSPRSGGAGTDVFSAQIDSNTGRVRGPVVRPIDNFEDWNSSPSLSPDGTSIAFMRRRPESTNAFGQDSIDLVVYNELERKERTHRYTWLDPSTPPVWSHDGKSVLVRRRYDGGLLLRVNVDTGETRQIESEAHALLPSGWQRAVLSPDDRTLYLSVRNQPEKGARGPTWNIIAFDIETADQKPIWSSEGILQTPPTFTLSPDGRAFAITLMRDSWKSPRLIRVGVDGGNIQELATSVSSRLVAWSKDVIYFSTAEDVSRLMRIPSAGGKAEPIGIAFKGGNTMDIGRDGSRIVFSQITREDNGLNVIDNLTSLWESTPRN